MNDLTIEELSSREKAAFVAVLDGIFEHSPWIAERAWQNRPFANIDELHQAMVEVVYKADADHQLALIRAHPELAGRPALAGELTPHSTAEQQSAGLNACTAAELDDIRSLNRIYQEKFGFPFVMAVAGQSKTHIIESMRVRATADAKMELRRSLDEIGKIARLRLDVLFSQPTVE